MNLFTPKKRTTDVVLSLEERAKKYLRNYYTKDDVTSIVKKPKFYRLEPNSINGIAQGTCRKENWLDKNNQPYGKYVDSEKLLNGCNVDIEYTDMSNNSIKDWEPIYFDKEVNGRKEKNDMPVWNRRGGEQLSKQFGNSYISSESARTVKLGGKKKKNRKTKKRT